MSSANLALPRSANTLKTMVYNSNTRLIMHDMEELDVLLDISNSDEHAFKQNHNPFHDSSM